jgi:peptide/nickel transport system substrate-binding protein
MSRVSQVVAAMSLVLVVACNPIESDDAAQPEEELGSGEAREGGELVIALAEEPDALDPSLARTFVGRIVFSSICEKLYDVNEELEIVPQLAAELPEVSEDGLTVTIPLRTGINFNDGTPFDADAVKQSLDRHLTIEGSSRASEIAAVEEVSVVDESTVELQLSEPFAPLTAAFADRAGMIMSPTQMDELGADFGDDPVCVGPFSFVNRVPQDRIVVEKSDEYYAADEVNLDRIVYRIIIDSNVRLSNLRSGDVHLAERLAPTDIASIEGDDEIQLAEATSIGYQGVDINIGNRNGLGKPHATPDNPLAQNPELREAFEMAIDRDTLNEVVFDGQVSPDCSPISPNSPFAVDVECTPFDPEGARQIVEDSGVQTPIEVEMVVANDPEGIRQGEVIQSMVEEAGFDLKVRPTEFTAALEETDAGNYETFQIGWSGRVDPDQNIHSFQHSEGSLNITGVDEPEIDRLLEEARVVQDQAERTDLYGQAIEQMNEVRGIIYLYHDVLFLGAASDVVGVEYFGDGLVRVSRAGFAAGSE